MTSTLEIRGASGWIMFIFGLLALLFGILSPFRPEALLSVLGFGVLDAATRAAGDYTFILSFPPQ